MEFLAPILGAMAVLVLVYSLTTSSRPRRTDVRLGKLDRGEATTEREDQLSHPFVERVGMPLMGFLRGSITRLLPGSIVTSIDHRLRLAGEPMSTHAFSALQLGVLLVAALLFLGALSMVSGMLIFVAFVVCIAIAAAPYLWLDSAVGDRGKKILRALPDTVDLIVTMVEAGMSIDSALAKVSQETEGPLSDELRFTLRETTLGRSRREALGALLERTDVSELRSFVQAILHAQATGVPLGQVLRTQADEIRLKKRQRAEAQAQKAPVKVLLLMLFFIMPALLLVLLGPSFMTLMDTF